MRRLHLFLLVIGLVVFGCTPNPTEVASVPTATLQGPIVPTRAPTLTETPVPATVAETPTDAPTEVTPSQQPSVTALDVTAQANVPTDTPVVPTVTLAVLTNTPAPTDTLPPTATQTNTAAPTTTETVTASATATDLPSETPTATLAPSSTPTTVPPTDTPTATLTSTAVPTDLPTATVPAEATPVPSNLYGNSTALQPVMLESAIAAFSTISGSIDDANPARLYTYAGVGGEILNITMRKLNGDLDPFLLVIDPKGRELARNDDESAESLDASIRGFRLPESGDYIIVASRFGQQFGFSIGNFELSVTKASSSEAPVGIFSQVIAYGAEAEGTLEEDQVPMVYTFRGSQGDTISIQMTATSGDLDTRVTLMDNLGNPLVFNDDDLLNGTINSLIDEYILPQSGYYSILAFHYTGAPNSGEFSLSVTLEEPAVAGELRPIAAALNPENSRTIRADGQFFGNFSAGDSLDEEDAEFRTESLLTFFLPPLPEGTQLQNASFEIAPCYETGDGFEALGTLTIYNDNYGRLNQTRDFTRPASGARILATMEQCDSLDVTDLVREVYTAGGNSVQFRLSFRSPGNNGQGDEVLFTPRLLLTPGE